MKYTNEQINKMAAEVLGICDEHIWVNESSSGLVLCKICKRSKHHESTYPDFCNDLNAAQRLVEKVGSKAQLAHIVWELISGNIFEILIASPKSITLVALVNAGKIKIQDAKETLETAEEDY